MSDPHPLRRRAAAVLRMVLTIIAATVLAVPAVSWASHQFDDVPDGAFHDEIAWLANNGVTVGCGDGSEFCPNEFVRRKQMAAFLYRLETRGVFLPADGKAADADRLDGKDASAFLGAGERADDSDRLDGLDSTDFARPLHAVVTASGTLARGTATASTRVTTGSYEVLFDRNVRNCSYVVSVGGSGFTTYRGFASAVQRGADTKGVFVQTHDRDGVIADLPFHLIVMC